jgi:NAD(P)-dependent dehydrogenase (short-subunit alcohol dehydrogenase family)
MVTSNYPEFVSFTKTWHSEPYPLISPTRPEVSAAGKNVVVTGGGTGIGQAIALAFAKAGAKSITVIGRRREPLEAAASKIRNNFSQETQAFCQVADLQVREQIDRALGAVVSKSGRIDILVSCAGLLAPNGAIATYEPALLRRAFEVNVVGTLNVIQAFTTHAGPDPTLIHVSSGTVHTRPIAEQGAYNATKLAALKVVDQFCAENPSFQVVSIHPGWVATEMNGMQPEAPDSRA